MLRIFTIKICVLLLQISSAFATSVEPTELEISSAGAGRTAQLTVHNDNARQVPFDLQIFRVEIDETGEVRRTPSSDFIVFPPQRLIDAHGAQVFRIQWAGAPLQKSQTYLALVRQLPVKMPKESTGMQVVVNIETLIHVAPASGTHTLDLVSAGIATVKGDNKEKRVPALLLSNSGNVNAVLADARITLRDGDWSKTLTPADLRQMVGIGVLQPGKRRKFLLPLELPPNVTKLNAEISYETAMR
jgi:P pilus assembly chaperone PapD